MSRPRKPPNLTTKLAAALCQMPRPTADGTGWEPAIPYEDAKRMSAEQVLSLFHFDHAVLHAHDGSDEHWNLTPRFIPEHRTKTAKRDVPAIAKVRHLAADQEAFRTRLLAKQPGEKRKPKGTIPSRPFPKRPKKPKVTRR